MAQWTNTIHRRQRRKRACTMIVRCFGAHRRCRRQRPTHIACPPPPNPTNTSGNWSNSIRWTLSLPFGKWSTYSYRRRSCTATLAIENVRIRCSFGHNLIIISSCIWNSNFFRFLNLIETKSQFARDDPAFLVLLILCVFGKWIHSFLSLAIGLTELNWRNTFIAVTSIGFTWTLDLTFAQTIFCILYIIVVDVIIIGIITTTFTWFVANQYLRERNSESDIEWGYCFDVHLNAFFPSLVLLHFVQLIFFNSEYIYH